MLIVLVGVVVVVVVVVGVCCCCCCCCCSVFSLFFGGREWDFAPEMSDNKVDVWNNIEYISPPNTATVHKYVLLFSVQYRLC